MTEQERINKSFNEGCDAKLAGKRSVDNPYAPYKGADEPYDAALEKAWLRGYEDVAQHWNKPEKRRKF